MKPLRENYGAWLAENPEQREWIEAQDLIRHRLVHALVVEGQIPSRAIANAGLWPHHIEAALAETTQKLDDAEDLAKKHRQTIQDMDATIRQLRRERDSQNPDDLNPDMYARVMDRARRSVIAEVQQSGPESLWPGGVPTNGRRRWRR